MFTTVDGLAHNVVNAVVRDSRGFIWFCTREGLSRFDGHAFITFGTPEGLPSGVINALLEVSERQYWIATARGLTEFDPSGSTSVGEPPMRQQRFTTHLPGSTLEAQFVTAVYRDGAGRLWVGTLAGLFIAKPGPPQSALTFELVVDKVEVTAITEDPRGTIWAGTSKGIVSYRDRARIYRDGALNAYVNTVWIDPAGPMWVGTSTGLQRLDVRPGTDDVDRVESFGRRDGLPTEWISQIIRGANGRLWIATTGGIAQLEETPRRRFHAFELSPTLTAFQTLAIAEDGGHLWIGTTRGAARAATSSFTIFDASSGIASGGAIFATPGGDIMVMGAGADWEVHRHNGSRFVPLSMRGAAGQATWGWNQISLIDRAGSWWTGTRRGLLQFDAVADPDQLPGREPTHVFDRRAGLSADVVLRVFEDSRSDIWVSTVGEGRFANGLSRWQRSTNRWTHFTDADRLLPLDRYYVSAFAETSRGSLWLGFSGDGGLVRYRDGRFERFDGNDGVPSGLVRNLLVDARGNLWAASYRNGLVRLASPEDDRPQVRVWNRTAGLSSNEVSALAEDLQGRIYAGTGRGINRLNPETEEIRRYESLESLGEFQGGLRDTSGAIWFSCASGVLRVLPEDEQSQSSRPTYITGLRINSTPQSVSAIGEDRIAGLRLAAGTNSIELEFVAPAAAVPDEMYQILLEGADKDWSPPLPRRSIAYANLAAGSYRFRARSVLAGSVGPASEVTFMVIPPIWRRVWFLGSMGGAVSTSLLIAYRRRQQRRLAIASMRRRIARDLHDDIGANLTRIAVLSEVAQKRTNDGRPDGALASIARTARESVTTMADIVWAVSPKEDDVDDLARKLREYGDETCTAAGIRFSADFPASDQDRLDLDVRRDLYLIFKEAVTNAIRHSGGTLVRARIRRNRSAIVLEVADDGRGVPGARRRGQGLRNMEERAQRHGGRFSIEPSPEAGTTVRVELPARRSHLFRQVARGWFTRLG